MSAHADPCDCVYIGDGSTCPPMMSGPRCSAVQCGGPVFADELARVVSDGGPMVESWRLRRVEERVAALRAQLATSEAACAAMRTALVRVREEAPLGRECHGIRLAAQHAMGSDAGALAADVLRAAERWYRTAEADDGDAESRLIEALEARHGKLDGRGRRLAGWSSHGS